MTGGASRSIAAATLLVALATPLESSAAIVTWAVTGTVTEVGSADAAELGSLGVFVGTPFTASITYDSAPPIVSGSPVYQGAILDFTFEAAAYAPLVPVANYYTGIYELSTGLLQMSGVPSVTESLALPGLALQLRDADPAHTGDMPIAPPSFGSSSEFFLTTSGSDIAILSGSFAIDYSVAEPSADSSSRPQSLSG